MEKQAFRIVIIDDEAAARELMAELIAAHPQLELVGAAPDALKGLQLINKLKPDLVFLDINMPVMSGLELADLLMHNALQTKVVFVTAYDTYHVEAIRAAAFDYLLKPVDPDDLNALLERFAEVTQLQPSRRIKAGSTESSSMKIRLNIRTGYLLVEPADIILIQADGNYSEICLLGGEKLYVTQAIGHFCSILPSDMFIRISRSALINMKYLWKVDRKNRKVILKSKEQQFQITITREHLNELEERTK